MGILMAIAMIISLMAGLTQVAHAATTISSVGLNLVLPSAGDSYSGTAATSITSGTGFTITKANWYNGGTPETNPGCGSAPTSFEAGKPYYAEIELTAVDGYGFTESTAVTLTGGATVKTTQFDHGDKTLLIITKDITLSGAASYTYTFDFNGGSCTIPLASISYDPEAGLPSGPPSVITPPEGKVFDAWEIDGVRYEAGAKYPATANFVLKILWKDASAVTKYPVWVGDTQVTSANKDDILGDGKASFDPSTNTLTLNDPSISGFTNGAKIYADSLDLIISGSSTLEGDDTGIEVYNGSLTVNGNYTVKGTFDAIIAVNVSITGGTISLDADVGVNADGNLTITGGTVTADCNDTAISVDGNVTIASGTVTAKSGFGPGINAGGSIIVNGGSVTATGNNYGLKCNNYDGKIEINAGSVKATGTMDEGIYSTGHINIIGGTVEANGGGLGIYTPRILTIGNGIESVTAISHSDTAVHAHTVTLGDNLMIKEPENGTVGYKSGGDTILKESGDVADKVVIEPKEAPVTTYPVWVGETQVTSANKDDILKDGGSAKYDPDTHTLTLNDPTITGEPTGVSGAKIFIYDSSVTYTIDGTATIDGDIVMGNGWTADLVIKGNITAKRVVNPDHSVTVDGNLTLNSSSGFALRAKSITIASGTVDVTGSDYGIEGGTVTISGGTVMAKASSSTGSAIHAYTALSIAATHEIVLPAGGVLSSDEKDVCESDGTTIATEAKIAPKETVTEYPVWVGSTQVTSANKDDILGDGKASFDPTTNTLTLNDPSISGSYEGAKIYAKAMTLTVTGKVTLSGADFGIDVRGYSGYLGRLIISGTDTNIDATGNTSGISAKDGVVINGGTLRATGSIVGISSATVSISGEATVTATASAEPESYGIYASSNIVISNATVTATAGDGIGATGIFSNGGDITITGGTVTVTAGAGGIYAYDGEVKIENGTEKVEATVGTVAVRGKNGITIGDELMIKLPEGGTVESNSGSYDIMDGSSAARHALILPKEATTYTVTFDANGHGTAPAAQTVKSGEKATEPTAPTETGWTFGGWYKEAACTNAFDFSTPITGDITLYAKWTEESVTPVVITYNVTGGGNSTWAKGSTSAVTITVKRSEADDTCFSHFSGVQIDGATLSASDYEAKSGSTVVTLKAATLQKLSAGSHTVTILFDDGKAETQLTVTAATAPTDPTVPKTGDNSHMGLWTILMILSAIGLCGMASNRKKSLDISKR